MKTSEQFIQSMESEDEKERLQSKLDDVTKRWQALKDKVSGNLTEVDEVLPLAKLFRDTCDDFIDWLKSAEWKVENFEAVVGDKIIVNKQNEIAVEINNEILDHNGQFMTLKDAGNDVIGLAKKDIDVVKDELNDISKRWENLKVNLSEIMSRLSTVDTLLGEFANKLHPIDEVIMKCDDALKSVDPIGMDVEKNKKEVDKLEVRKCFSTLYSKSYRSKDINYIELCRTALKPDSQE